MAFLRGKIFRIASLFSSSYKIGKKNRIYSSVNMSSRNKSKLIIGDNVKINRNTTISSLSGGTLTIGSHVGIGEGNIIVCHDSIQIGDGTILAPHVFIYDHDHKYDHGSGVSTKEYRTSPVIIGKNCWIGANTVILRGTIIGDNCVIGAGSVIKGEFPSGVTVVQKRTTGTINLNERNIATSKGSD